MSENNFIIGHNAPILITGASGFIGTKVVERLLWYGFRNLRCFGRPSGDFARVRPVLQRFDALDEVELVSGNLLNRDDCVRAVRDASAIYHLAAGRGEKSFPDAFMNSVVTTRNLIEAALDHGSLKRFVNVSSFAVYSNRENPNGRVLDELAPMEERPQLRGDAYCFAKVKQDELVMEYGKKRRLPYVIVRPGAVYGPGNEAITSRVGIDTFGLFLHLGGSSAVPLTYVDNCAEAIVRAGLKEGVEGEVFNVVDDDLPSSRRFLGLYKKNVRRFHSLFLPKFASYALCWFWEKYSNWSQGQLPPAYNSHLWHAIWKSTAYSNQKLKQLLAWQPIVSTAEGLERYFESCRRKLNHA